MKNKSLILPSMMGIFLYNMGTLQAQESLALTKWEKALSNEEKDARKTADELINQLKNDYIKKNTRAFRDAHPRGIGCVAAKFTVEGSLPAEYLTGVFAKPGKSYDALIRFSSSLGPDSDNKPDARGMAVKLFGVPGRKILQDQADANTHDFLQIDAPIFPARDGNEFGGIVSIKSNPFNVVPFLAGAPFLRARELKALIDFTEFNPNNGKSMAERHYFSQVPYLLKGPKIETPVKFSSRPCSAVPKVALDGTENELRNDLHNRLQEGDLCFDFLMQFYKENVGLMVEDGMNEWKEAQAPYVKFARITIPKQTFRTDEKLKYCDSLSMQPWHALPEHRPIGHINRARKLVYEVLSDFRHQTNQENHLRKEPVDMSVWNSLKSTEYATWKTITVPAGS